MSGMMLFRNQIDFVRLVAIVVAGTFLSACMSWQTQSLEPERFRTADSTQTVRLTLTGGDTIIVHGPVITGDSLVGMQTRRGASADSLERVSVPLTAISQAERKKSDPAGNLLVGIGLIAAVAAMVAATNPCIVFCATQPQPR
jgi:hypothetical protein